MQYDFKEQVKDPRQKEANKMVCEFWRQEAYNVKDVSEDKNYFEKGIDLIRILGEEVWNIDVKCDFQANKTGNIVFELIEICAENGDIKVGWGYNKNLNEVDYFLWDSKECIFMNLQKLRKLVFSKERKGYSAYHNYGKFKYFTLGVIIPLSEIVNLFKIINLSL